MNEPINQLNQEGPETEVQNGTTTGWRALGGGQTYGDVTSRDTGGGK
jgi:hypothetical protein